MKIRKKKILCIYDFKSLRRTSDKYMTPAKHNSFGRVNKIVLFLVVISKKIQSLTFEYSVFWAIKQRYMYNKSNNCQNSMNTDTHKKDPENLFAKNKLSERRKQGFTKFSHECNQRN